MSYKPTTWQTGDVVTAEKLNNIEQGVSENNTEVTAAAGQINSLTQLVGGTPSVKSEQTDWTAGYYINTNQTVGSVIDVTNLTASSNRSYQVISVQSGDVCIVTGTGGAAPRLWAWTDTNYVLLSKSNSNVTETELELTAPSDGYLIVNVQNTRTYSVSKIIEMSVVEKLDWLETRIRSIQ